MLFRIIDTKYIKEYSIHFVFNNGENGVVDLEETVSKDHRKIFKDLLDMTCFRNFTLDNWTICWPNGLDIAPEFLYELMVKQTGTVIKR